MAQETYYAKIKLGNSYHYVQVQARYTSEAKKLIEAQYAGCRIVTGPTKTKLG